MKKLTSRSKPSAAKVARDQTKLLYAEAIHQNIAKKDWTRLSDVMMEAEAAGVGKTLRKKGWYHVGMYEAERENHPSAIIAFNFARMLDPTSNHPLSKMLEGLEAFCRDFDGRFSRQDLHMLAIGLERITSFHAFHSRASTSVREKGRRLSQWIDDRLRRADDKVETSASHHVQRIYSALYPPMTIEEVRAEFARIVEPLIRENLERRAEAASGGKGNGPKDPEDEEEDPPEKEPKGKK